MYKKDLCKRALALALSVSVMATGSFAAAAQGDAPGLESSQADALGLESDSLTLETEPLTGEDTAELVVGSAPEESVQSLPLPDDGEQRVEDREQRVEDREQRVEDREQRVEDDALIVEDDALIAEDGELIVGEGESADAGILPEDASEDASKDASKKSVVTIDSDGTYLPIPSDVAGTLEVGADVTVSISDDEYKWFLFTPAESGAYALYSYESDSDPISYLYASTADGLFVIAENDDGGEGHEFYLSCCLTAGETYYYAVSDYDGYGSFSMSLEKLDDAQAPQNIQEISVQRTNDATYVSTLGLLGDIWDGLAVTVSYKDGTAQTIPWGEDLDDGNIVQYRVTGPGGTTWADTSDPLMAGTYTFHAIAQGLVASIEVPVISMRDCATQDLIQLGTPHAIALEKETSHLGFQPEKTATYVLSSEDYFLSVLNIYDADTETVYDSDPHGTSQWPRQIAFEEGKTYLITVQNHAYEMSYQPESASLSIDFAKTIQAITAPDIKSNYSVLTAANYFCTLPVSISYVSADGTSDSETIDEWTEIGATAADRKTPIYFKATTANGDILTLSLWDGETQVDMPSPWTGSASGTFSLKLMCEDTVYFSQEITLDPVDAAAASVLLQGVPCPATSDNAAQKLFSFTPAQTNIYRFSLTGLDNFPEKTLWLYGEKNEELLSNDAASLTAILEAGKTYHYRVFVNGGPNVDFQALVDAYAAPGMALGENPLPDDGHDLLWYAFTPTASSLYEFGLSYGVIGDVTAYDSAFSRIKGYINYSDVFASSSLRRFVRAGETIYFAFPAMYAVHQVDASFYINELPTSVLQMDQPMEASSDHWLVFAPPESGMYRISTEGTSGTLYWYEPDEASAFESFYFERTDFSCTRYLQKDNVYRFQMESSGSNANAVFRVAVTKAPELTFVEVLPRPDFIFEANDPFHLKFDLRLNYEAQIDVSNFLDISKNCIERFDGHAVRCNLYETDASGTPDYDKLVEEYRLPAGTYAFVVEIGSMQNDQFLPLTSIAPIVTPVEVYEEASKILEQISLSSTIDSYIAEIDDSSDIATSLDVTLHYADGTSDTRANFTYGWWSDDDSYGNRVTLQIFDASGNALPFYEALEVGDYRIEVTSGDCTASLDVHVMSFAEYLAQQDAITELRLEDAVTAANRSCFTFTPTETESYTAAADDMGYHWLTPDGTDRSQEFLEAGVTYYLICTPERVVAKTEKNEPYTVRISKYPKLLSVETFLTEYLDGSILEDDNHADPATSTIFLRKRDDGGYIFHGYVGRTFEGLEPTGGYLHSIDAPDAFAHIGGGYAFRGAIYEADAYGTTNFAKRVIGEMGDSLYYSYDLPVGIYTYIAEAGYLLNGQFVALPSVSVEPGKMTIVVTEQEHASHTFAAYDEVPATCTTPGKTVQLCSVCGYKDPASVKETPAIGKHIGGAATCEKGAICQFCGKEYTTPTGHSGGTATCEKGAICQSCGKEYTAPTGHSGGTATCERGAICTICKKEYTPAGNHSFGPWQQTSDATVFKKAVESRSCSFCGKEETREIGGTLTPFIKLNATSLTMRTKQKTTKLTVETAAGDSIASVTTSNKKVLTASVKNGGITLTAKSKTGKANLTITLASGTKKTIKVTVQKSAVKTKKISGISKKLTLKKKQRHALKPVLAPITSQDKIKYSTSNKKVATVSSKGVITAKKKGTATITVRAGKKSVKCKITVK